MIYTTTAEERATARQRQLNQALNIGQEALEAMRDLVACVYPNERAPFAAPKYIGLYIDDDTSEVVAWAAAGWSYGHFVEFQDFEVACVPSTVTMIVRTIEDRRAWTKAIQRMPVPASILFTTYNLATNRYEVM